MLNYTSAKILLCVAPTDMRKSFDGLAALAREHLKSDPLSGTWFVFRNRRGDKLKLLCRTEMATRFGKTRLGESTLSKNDLRSDPN
ncbi:IS66 family insertion sequence element accessory protein TnpB [Telmatocola sphagniphila]|uniref:IS66 family insertion sequence element accessory protein TnpB n=1 Tax=Telmatocola sphagniphila TaxID=1123043 RepID=A0A8E6B832_9BACT|nr:IS66 family insertion sequence element accessory protein TnpB [Telmatocola sphagniphila]QVL33855.1 IS66 family insertion sequence element accessory protein TnpB [Telmatocola sphagniphila]